MQCKCTFLIFLTYSIIILLIEHKRGPILPSSIFPHVSHLSSFSSIWSITDIIRRELNEHIDLRFSQLVELSLLFMINKDQYILPQLPQKVVTGLYLAVDVK